MGEQAFERWNTHFSNCVEQEVLGVTLRLAQDPSSEHLGTTVWDASIVLAKYFEKNIRKGDFARSKVAGRRAIELGAGMGLAGLALAMLGVDVTLTDVKDVLPLLKRNYEQNLSPAALRASGNDTRLGGNVGAITVAELDWADPRHLAGVNGPFDYVLAADCIYHENLVRDLYRAILELTTERSTVVIANERRSESVQKSFLDLFTPSFSMRKVPLAKQHPDFQHPAIELYIMKKKKGASVANLLQLQVKEAADIAEALEGLSLLAGSAGPAAAAAAVGQNAGVEGDASQTGTAAAVGQNAGDEAETSQTGTAAAGVSLGSMERRSSPAEASSRSAGAVGEAAQSAEQGDMKDGGAELRRQNGQMGESPCIDAAAELLLSAAATAAAVASSVGEGRGGCGGPECSRREGTPGSRSSCDSSKMNGAADGLGKHQLGVCQVQGAAPGMAGSCACGDDMEVDEKPSSDAQRDCMQGVAADYDPVQQTTDAMQSSEGTKAAAGPAEAAGGAARAARSTGLVGSSSKGEQLSWEERRRGAMAARLLAGIQPPSTSAVQQHALFQA